MPNSLNALDQIINLRLSGGLGNQLFQIAAAGLLCKRYNRIVSVHLEGLKRYKSHRDPDFIKVLGINGWLNTKQVEKIDLPKYLSVTARLGRLPIVGVNDKNFWWMVERKPSLLPLYMDGYFQRGWTAATFAEALATLSIEPITEKNEKRIESSEVVIHIRGGDFLQLPLFQVANMPFYAEAVRQAYARGYKQFAVITDDPEYANQICSEISLSTPHIQFRILGRGISSHVDFDTLRCASARIIGNSTFAWWASALGRNGGPTWSPNKFITNALRDFYLPGEITIEV
jgi:hypothetical protein